MRIPRRSTLLLSLLALTPCAFGASLTGLIAVQLDDVRMGMMSGFLMGMGATYILLMLIPSKAELHARAKGRE